MDNEKQRPERCLGNHVPPYVWQAILAIQNHFFAATLLDWIESTRPKDHIHQAMMIVDCWCDAAIQNGWIEDEQDT